ncbi:MAG: hypothetical protein JSR46_01890 [Verrucomicrobia bacterium]|nr:hypothetical protein [Verrucomicrobiota bacterium]
MEIGSLCRDQNDKFSIDHELESHSKNEELELVNEAEILPNLLENHTDTGPLIESSEKAIANYIRSISLQDESINGKVVAIKYLDRWETGYNGTAVHFELDDGSKWAIHSLHGYIFLQGTAKNKEVTITPMNQEENFIGKGDVLFNYWLTITDSKGIEHKEAVALLSGPKHIYTPNSYPVIF